MKAIKARVKDGRLELQVPPDWLDGTEVVLQPIGSEDGPGIAEEDGPDSPQASAEWLEWYDSLEPLIFTDEERAEWEAGRREQKEREKATFEERAEKLWRMWE